MEKKYRIKKNQEFQAVFKNGRSFANRQFVIYVLEKKEQPNFRIGLSVSKRIGNAVVRNQVKRYIRQIFFEVKDILPPDKDYVIIARRPAATMDYYQVKSSLFHVLKKASLIQRSNKRAKS